MILDRTMQRVLAAVSVRHGVPETALVGTAYQRRDRRAMWEAVWLYHEITGARAQAIAHALGRNHSTATYALAQINATRAAKPAYAADLDRIADHIADELGAPGRAERQIRQHFGQIDRGICHRATQAVGRLLLIAQRDPAIAAEILRRLEEDVSREHERSAFPDRCHVGAASPAPALAPFQPLSQLAKESLQMTTTTAIPEGFWKDTKGRLVPGNLVRPADKLIDQTVRKIIGFATELNAQIARFKGHTFDDIVTCMSLIGEQYGAKIGGEKGNVTLTTFDGCMRVQVQVSDRITFGPELQVAKGLIDECISAWSADANPHIRVIVQDAFRVDGEGRLNREAILSLRRLAIEDETWGRAMQALTDSIRVEGSATYVRFYARQAPTDSWSIITVDLASAKAPGAAPTPADAA